jgi:hypothetical protein
MTDDRFARRLPDLMDQLAGHDELYLDDVLAHTARTRQRPAWAFPGRWVPALDHEWTAFAPARTVVLALVLVALLALLLATMLFVGSGPDPIPVQRSYEAVVLRQSAANGPIQLLIVGVNSDGHEREIARLQGVMVDPYTGDGGYWPSGAVSTTGLLAIPNGTPRDRMHWEIIDLLQPEAAPTVVAGIEQYPDQLQQMPYVRFDGRPSVLWGPNDQLAIPWYDRPGVDQHLSFVDGRTGAATAVDIPEPVRMLPYWASDGSGVFVTDFTDLVLLNVLQPDGALGDASSVAPSGLVRRHRSDGAWLDMWGWSVVRRHGDGGQESLLKRTGVEVTDLAWTAAGDGAWLAVRSGRDARQLTVERAVPPTEPEQVTTIADPIAGPSRMDGQFIGLAPDDSMLVVSMDRVTEERDGSSHEGVDTFALVVPGGGESYTISGSFAGFLEVRP